MGIDRTWYALFAVVGLAALVVLGFLEPVGKAMRAHHFHDVALVAEIDTGAHELAADHDALEQRLRTVLAAGGFRIRSAGWPQVRFRIVHEAPTSSERAGSILEMTWTEEPRKVLWQDALLFEGGGLEQAAATLVDRFKSEQHVDLAPGRATNPRGF